MNTNKLPLYILLGLLYITAALWFSSYFLYSWYGYENMIYPFHIIEFALHHYDRYPHARPTFWIAVALPLIPPLGLLGRIRRPKALHGDARWANLAEITAMNLIRKPAASRHAGDNGILFCKYRNAFPLARRFFLADRAVEHVSVIAPTRSGKGVGVVIPNLLEWAGSAVVLDIKYENYEITAHRRRHDLGNDVYFFAPGNRHSHRWNPFDLINLDDPFGMATVDMIAITLCPDSKGADNPMWEIEGRNLFRGSLIYLLRLARYHNEPSPSLGELNSWMREKTDEEQMQQVLDSIEEDPAFKATLPEICISLLKNFMIMPEKQRGSVQTTITSRLSIYDNPAINAAVSASDFDIRDLRRRKMTIYLGANPKTMANLGTLFGMFFQLTANEMTSYLPQNAPPDHPEPHKVLLLMDEFTSMGELQSIKKGIAFFAGYHVRLIIIIQGKSQLESIYQRAGLSEFLSNFKFQIIYAPNDPQEAKELSDALGTDTVRAYSRSLPSFLSKSDRSYNESEQARALITPDEVLRLDRSKAILRIEAQRPVLGEKIIYWSDPHFAGKFWNILNADTKQATAARRPPPPPAIVINTTTLEERIAAKRGITEQEKAAINQAAERLNSSAAAPLRALKRADPAPAPSADNRMNEVMETALNNFMQDEHKQTDFNNSIAERLSHANRKFEQKTAARRLAVQIQRQQQQEDRATRHAIDNRRHIDDTDDLNAETLTPDPDQARLVHAQRVATLPEDLAY